VVSASDMYPFGMTMPGRSFNASKYRYGFNGIEKESDCGCGEIYAAPFRHYDARLGRWFSVDPETDDDADLSPYVNNENNPIINSDPDGDCPWCFVKALIDGGIEIAGQLASGKKFSQIDWTDVAVSSAQGFVSGLNPAGWVNTSKNLIKAAKVAQKLVHHGGEVLKAAVDNGKVNSLRETVVNYTVAATVDKVFKSKRASKLLKPTSEAVKKAVKVSTNISKQVAQKSKAVQTAIANGSKNSTILKKVEQLKNLSGKQAQAAVNVANAQAKQFGAQTTMSVAKETTENVNQDLINGGINMLSTLQQKGEFTNVQTTHFFNKWVNGGSDRTFSDFDGNQWRFTGKENTYDPKNIELVKRKGG
jgi:RHS repeat-associated protein